jgi:uncharacterized protein YciW
MIANDIISYFNIAFTYLQTTHIAQPQLLAAFKKKLLKQIFIQENVSFSIHVATVKEEIQRLSSQYSARLNSHPNLLTANLKKQPTN